jgi:transposase
MKQATKKLAEGSSCQNQGPICAVVGIDLGDKRSTYHVLDLKGASVGEGIVTTKADALKMLFSGTGTMRIVMECGTHSPWASRTLQELGHEVIVANPRRLRLISESDRKSDKADARLLAKLAQAAPDLLSPVQHRSEQVQFDLAIIKARDTAVLSRARLVTAIRGIVKSVGGRLQSAPRECSQRRRSRIVPLNCWTRFNPSYESLNS